MAKRFYIRNSVVPFEEDFMHEFKGHRNICFEDLPPWTQESKTDRASRRAVSRSLNAFLNTGKGGTVYLGVLDSGVVKGLQLSDYQDNYKAMKGIDVKCRVKMDGKEKCKSHLVYNRLKEKVHVIESVKDVMGRYTPPVRNHRYSVKFVPVYDSTTDDITILPKRLEHGVDLTGAGRPHELRKHTYCWCDRDSVMQYNAGIMHEDYVVEIKINPWDYDDDLNRDDGYGTLVNIHPIHEDEGGNCFFRRQASLIQYTMTELARLTRQEVEEVCLQKIASLKKEIAKLQAKRGEKLQT